MRKGLKSGILTLGLTLSLFGCMETYNRPNVQEGPNYKRGVVVSETIESNRSLVNSGEPNFGSKSIIIGDEDVEYRLSIRCDNIMYHANVKPYLDNYWGVGINRRNNLNCNLLTLADAIGVGDSVEFITEYNRVDHYTGILFDSRWITRRKSNFSEEGVVRMGTLTPGEIKVTLNVSESRDFN